MQGPHACHCRQSRPGWSFPELLADLSAPMAVALELAAIADRGLRMPRG